MHLGLLAAGIGAGDEVIVPSFTFAATANAVALTGARPVFADIEARHFCLDPDAVEAARTGTTQTLGLSERGPIAGVGLAVDPTLAIRTRSGGRW